MKISEKRNFHSVLWNFKMEKISYQAGGKVITQTRGKRRCSSWLAGRTNHSLGRLTSDAVIKADLWLLSKAFPYTYTQSNWSCREATRA